MYLFKTLLTSHPKIQPSWRLVDVEKFVSDVLASREKWSGVWIFILLEFNEISERFTVAILSEEGGINPLI